MGNEAGENTVGAQLLTIVLGFLIFIDDYFNCIAVGHISRPVTDRHRLSRAKLAYLIDSTAAPMCVLAPISSWGAYIITIIAGILTMHSVTEYEAIQAFILLIPMNYYALLAIIFMIAVVIFKLDIGQMKIHENRAQQTGELVAPGSQLSKAEPDEMSGNVGKVGYLVWPLTALVCSTVIFMLLTGAAATEGELTLLSIFENMDVAVSLVYGGLIGFAIAALSAFLAKLPLRDFTRALGSGIKSMLPAIYILILAWMMIEIISELGTGQYLASLIDGTIPVMLLPVLLFLVAGFAALSTGTSWGTFSLLLPIAGEMAAVIQIDMLLPMLAAVLAGAIFGDHCSPISDTTILSSAGAGSTHIDHVLTQLPYTLIVAGISVIAYLVLGATGSAILGLLAGLVLLSGAVLLLRQTVHRQRSKAF